MSVTVTLLEQIVEALSESDAPDEFTLAQLGSLIDRETQIPGVIIKRLKDDAVIQDTGKVRETGNGGKATVWRNLRRAPAKKATPVAHDPFAAFPKQPIPEPTIGDTPLFTFSEEPKRDRYLDLLNYMEKQEAALKENPDRYFHILTHGKVKLCLKYDA